MLGPGQLASLTEMGISVWELRPPEVTTPAITVEPVIAGVVQPLPAVDCLMVVTEQDDSEEAQRLLRAMLFSIGLTTNNSAIISTQQLGQLQTSSYDYKVLVAFGEQLVPHTLNSQAIDRGQIYSSHDSTLKIIISLSLTTLLNSPDKKTLAWQDLQLLKTVYQAKAPYR